MDIKEIKQILLTLKDEAENSKHHISRSLPVFIKDPSAEIDIPVNLYYIIKDGYSGWRIDADVSIPYDQLKFLIRDFKKGDLIMA